MKNCIFSVGDAKTKSMLADLTNIDHLVTTHIHLFNHLIRKKPMDELFIWDVQGNVHFKIGFHSNKKANKEQIEKLFIELETAAKGMPLTYEFVGKEESKSDCIIWEWSYYTS